MKGLFSLKKIPPLVACLICLLAAGCGKKERHFWYPIALKEVKCSTYKGELYLMTNSRGWRSWPHYLDPGDKREIELGTDCVMKVIKRLPKYERNIEASLNDEQAKYLIEGF